MFDIKWFWSTISSTKPRGKSPFVTTIYFTCDIHLKAANGKIKLEALDIELIANGNAPQGVIWANAYETLKLDSKNVTIDGKQSCKIMTSGLMTIRGGLGTQMLSPLIEGVSAAMSKLKLPEPAEVNKE